MLALLLVLLIVALQRPGTPPLDTPFAVSPREARWVNQLLSDDWEAQKAATHAILNALGARLLGNL